VAQLVGVECALQQVDDFPLGIKLCANAVGDRLECVVCWFSAHQ
jgi:hypothetical protein